MKKPIKTAADHYLSLWKAREAYVIMGEGVRDPIISVLLAVSKGKTEALAIVKEGGVYYAATDGESFSGLSRAAITAIMAAMVTCAPNHVPVPGQFEPEVAAGLSLLSRALDYAATRIDGGVYWETAFNEYIGTNDLPDTPAMFPLRTYKVV